MFPIPAFPRCPRITFHGSTDYGEHHAIMGSTSRPRCAPWRLWRLESGQGGLIQQFGAGLRGKGSPDAAPEAGGSGTATRTRSYAHCGLEDMSANNEGKQNNDAWKRAGKSFSLRSSITVKTLLVASSTRQQQHLLPSIINNNPMSCSLRV